jgi:hypothetical protein
MWYSEVSQAKTKRKIFISFYQGDRAEVDAFIHRWADDEGVFIAKALGISDNDDFIDSTDTAYVMSRIRERYLSDSTVTVVLLGTCTHSRRYVDWELKTSLRLGGYTPNGVMGILLPSGYPDGVALPPRLQANWNKENRDCYARYYWYPESADQLRGWIEDAFQARTSRAAFIQNSSDMMKYNAKCRACDETH